MAEPNLALQIYQSIVGVIGFCGNGLVCVVIAKVHFMHTLTNAFIFNQALVDMLGSLVVLLSSVVPAPNPLPPGAQGLLLCKLWLSGYLNWVMFVASTVNLEALTLERYLAIVFPFRYQKLATRRNATIAIIAVWLSALLFATYNIYMRYPDAGQCKTRDVAIPQFHGVAGIFMVYLLPVFVMIVVYSHIALVLKRGAGRVLPGPAAAGSSSDGQGESLMRARRNTFKTLVIVSVAFLICWTPNAIIFLLFNFGVAVDFNSALWIVTAGMVATNGCVNPFIYAFKYKQFQKALKTFFGRRVSTDDGFSSTRRQ